jgi:hypothetical protein
MTIENRCVFWIMINYSLFLMSIILMAWTSIERYLFIYHERFMLRHIISLHYIPIIVIILYSIFFYVGTVLLYNCESTYNVHLYVCGGACYRYRLEFGLIDVIINAMGSVWTTFIVNIILITRHVVQRRRMKRSVIPAKKSQEWVRFYFSHYTFLFIFIKRRSLKLSIQLLSISLLYLISWMPYATIGLIQIFKNTPFLTYLLSTFFIYLPYCPVLFLPFICLFSMPDIKRKFDLAFNLFYHRFTKPKQNQVHIITKNPPECTTRPPLVIQL